MKTTKTLTAKVIEGIIFNDGVNYGYNCSNDKCDYTVKERIDMIKKYAEIKCSEQKKICQDIYDLSDAIIGDVFLNAPKPKFD